MPTHLDDDGRLRPWSEVYSDIKDAFKQRDLARAHGLIDPYEELARATDDTEQLGKVAFIRGICFDLAGQYDQAVDAFNEAIEYDTRVWGVDSSQVAAVRFSLGLVYQRLQQPREAADLFVAAEQGFRAVGDPRADRCLLAACSQLTVTCDFDRVLAFDGLINDAADPVDQVTWLIFKASAFFMPINPDPVQRKADLQIALDIIATATRITKPASFFLQVELGRAWLTLAFIALAYGSYSLGGLALSMARHFEHELDTKIADRINAELAHWAARGVTVQLTNFAPTAFIIAAKSPNDFFVFHRDHGMLKIPGAVVQSVGETVELVIDTNGRVALA